MLHQGKKCFIKHVIIGRWYGCIGPLRIIFHMLLLLLLLRLQKLQQQQQMATTTSNTSSSKRTTAKSSLDSTTTTTATTNKGKEKRQWHDGNAKVTKEAMAELDRSSPNNNDDDDDRDDDDEDQDHTTDRALMEARAAYLPTDADLQSFTMTPSTPIDDQDDSGGERSWGTSLQGLFQQMTGQKVLSQPDLQQPLQEIHRLLTSKNVASDIAQLMCDKVQEQLLGKKLNSMYRVKTAVRQALESTINKLLLPSQKLDLLRQVISKRDGSFFSTAMTSTRRPYVIVVVGINGVGTFAVN